MKNKIKIIYNKYLKNTKLRTLIKLLLWILFFLYLLFEIIIPIQKMTNYQKTQVEENNKVMNFADYKNDLIENNFNFKYTVVDNGQKSIYSGSLLKYEAVGYKETGDLIEKFYIKNGNVYRDILGSLEPVDYDFEDENYLNVQFIFDKIGNDYIYDNDIFTFENDDLYGKIYVDGKRINKIEIVHQNINYLLEFSNVGEIIKIDY